MTDRRAGRVPHVGLEPRARRRDGRWWAKRSDAGKRRKRRKKGLLDFLFGS